MSGVGVDLIYHGHSIGTCVLIGSLLVFLLEIAWALQLFLHVCLRQEEGGQPASDETGCGSFRAAVQWCDKPSKKGFLYVVLGAVILLWPQHRLWLSPVAGVMLLLLSTLYFLLTLKKKGEARDTLLQGRDGSFDRFDDVSEVLDDSLPEPLAPGGSGGLPTTPVPGTLSVQFPLHVPRSSPPTHHAVSSPTEKVATTGAVGDRSLETPAVPSGDAGRHVHALVDGFGDQEIILRM
ncbi:uncharacterized protein [Hetaerina americana]